MASYCNGLAIHDGVTSEMVVNMRMPADNHYKEHQGISRQPLSRCIRQLPVSRSLPLFRYLIRMSPNPPTLLVVRLLPLCCFSQSADPAGRRLGLLEQCLTSNTVNDLPDGLPDLQDGLQDLPDGLQDGPKDSKMASKMASKKASKMSSKTSKMASKTSKMASKMTSRTSKMTSKTSKMASKMYIGMYIAVLTNV